MVVVFVGVAVFSLLGLLFLLLLLLLLFYCGCCCCCCHGYSCCCCCRRCCCFFYANMLVLLQLLLLIIASSCVITARVFLRETKSFSFPLAFSDGQLNLVYSHSRSLLENHFFYFHQRFLAETKSFSYPPALSTGFKILFIHPRIFSLGKHLLSCLIAFS